MVSRYFILSGIPVCQFTLCKEIQNMVSFLVEKIQPPNDNCFSGEEIKISLFFLFFSYEWQYYNIIFYFFLVLAIINGLENSNFPDWNTFEFITEKVGRRGPSKDECIQYYNQKLVFYLNYS